MKRIQGCIFIFPTDASAAPHLSPHRGNGNSLRQLAKWRSLFCPSAGQHIHIRQLETLAGVRYACSSVFVQPSQRVCVISGSCEVCVRRTSEESLSPCASRQPHFCEAFRSPARPFSLSSGDLFHIVDGIPLTDAGGTAVRSIASFPIFEHYLSMSSICGFYFYKILCLSFLFCSFLVSLFCLCFEMFTSSLVPKTCSLLGNL